MERNPELMSVICEDSVVDIWDGDVRQQIEGTGEGFNSKRILYILCVFRNV